MKKIYKLIIITLILVIGTSSIDAYANGIGTVVNKIWDYWQGGASSFSMPNSENNVANGGKKCGEDMLCFNGAGVYIKLIHYDYKTKTEKIVGKPILIHTKSFLQTATVIRKGAEEDQILYNSNNIETNDDTANSCTIYNTYFYEFEELEKYTGDNISYYIEENGIQKPIAKSDIIFKEDDSLTYGESGEGIVNYIKSASDGLITQYASSLQTLKSSFQLSDTVYNDLILNMDNYYLVFEPVVREKNSNGGTSGVEQAEPKKEPMSSTVGKSTYKCSTKSSLTEVVDYGTKPTSDACSKECTTVGKVTETKWKGTYETNSGNTGSVGSNFDSKEACEMTCSSASSTTPGGFKSCKCTSYQKTINSGTQVCGVWEIENVCSTPGVNNTAALKTKIYFGTSTIKPAKYTNKVKWIKSVVTTKDETSCNGSGAGDKGNCIKHCVLDKNNICTGKYEYYIGPSLKTALVGSPDENNNNMFHNKYKLYSGNGNDISSNSFTQNGYTVGTSYWWIPGFINCKRECGTGTGNEDSRLQCAENYCDNAIGYDDRMNTQKFKHTCITSTCGYTYTPMSCTKPDGTVNTEVDIYSNESNYSSKKFIQSTCSIINTETGTKTKTEDSPNIITTCEEYDKNKTIFDQKTYLIVACKESAAFQYADLSKTKIVAGEGLNYFANLHGGKECTVSFDIDSWKVAYASYHSEDLICQGGSVDNKGNCIGGTVISPRKLLENVLNYYNKCSIGVAEDEETKKLCDIGGDAIGINMDGTPVETTWTSLGYNTNKVEVKTKVAEVINNTKNDKEDIQKLPTYTLIENKNKTDSSVVATSEKNAYSFAENQRKNFGKVKTYLSTSNVEVNYTFDKYCVTTDGKATIYKASSDGKCKQDSGVESKEVLGRNVYFTSLNATPSSEITVNDTHAINTTEVVVKNENEIEYLQGSEYCPYKIEDVGLSCSIEIELMDSTTTHGSDIYDGKVKAILNVHNQLGTKDKIVSTEISYESCNGSTEKDANEIEISMCNSKNGVEIKDVNGSVTTKNGMTVECDKIIKLVNPCNNATACSVNKVSGEEKLYEIKTTYPGTAHYALTTDIKLHENLENPEKEGFKKILKSNGKNYVTVNEISENSRLYGMVTDSVGGKCVCWEDIYGVGDRDHFKCKTQCTDRTNEKAVKSFCNLHWHEDMDNYSSFSQCVEECKLGCPKELTCDIDQIKSYCDINHSKYNRSASGCVNYMYNECNCSGTDYIYRPINNSNPFPNSYESPIPGNREIGGNWVGKTEYITEDNNDSTSVTGANAGVSVEYEIHLTPSDIQKIRENTESYVSEGKDPYLDYIGVEQGKDGYCLEDGYCSEFINSSEFSTTIFKVK